MEVMDIASFRPILPRTYLFHIMRIFFGHEFRRGRAYNLDVVMSIARVIHTVLIIRCLIIGPFVLFGVLIGTLIPRPIQSWKMRYVKYNPEISLAWRLLHISKLKKDYWECVKT